MTAEERLALTLDKLRELAAECSECDGTKVSTEYRDRVPGDITQGLKSVEIDCPLCADILDVITRCSA